MDERLQQLEDQVALLGLTLEDLRRRLSQEVSTQRVVVVDEAGIVRVVLSAEGQVGSVLVRADRPEGETVGIELYAMDDDKVGAQVGLGTRLGFTNGRRIEAGAC
jgi:hypothetical protein